MQALAPLVTHRHAGPTQAFPHLSCTADRSVNSKLPSQIYDAQTSTPLSSPCAFLLDAPLPDPNHLKPPPCPPPSPRSRSTRRGAAAATGSRRGIMASAAAAPPPTPPESDPRLVEVFTPFLEKLIKNASWRNKVHSKLSHTAKSILDRLQKPPPPPAAEAQSPSTPTSAPSTPTSSSAQPGPLRSLSLADSELLLAPVTSALGSGSAKLAEAALELLHRLIAHSYIHGEADPSADPSAQLVASLLDAACNALGLDDEHIEIGRAHV